jgi:hypothetical protein
MNGSRSGQTGINSVSLADEISEYAWLRDSGKVSVGKLVDVLCGALKR